MTAETQLHPHPGVADTAAEAFPREIAQADPRAAAETVPRIPVQASPHDRTGAYPRIVPADRTEAAAHHADDSAVLHDRAPVGPREDAPQEPAPGAQLPAEEHVWWRTVGRRSPLRRGVRMPWVDDPAEPTGAAGLTDPAGLTHPAGLTDPAGFAGPAESAESPGPEATTGSVIMRTPVPMPAHEFDIECLAVTPETPEITSFTFRRRDGRPLGFRPGQYLNVAFPTDADGGLRERNYSLSSSPTDPAAFRLSIKREDSGTVSRWAHDHVRPGTVLEALGPLGGFHLPDFDRRARYLLLAAGVGITPLISMARTLHTLDDSADVVVLHHASAPRDFAFARELRILDETDPRFTVHFSLGDRPCMDWRGLTGRISTDTLDALVPDACGRMVFACGPPEYLTRVATVVEALGVSPVSFFTETFDDTTTGAEPPVPSATTTGAGLFAPGGTTALGGTTTLGGTMTLGGAGAPSLTASSPAPAEAPTAVAAATPAPAAPAPAAAPEAPAPAAAPPPWTPPVRDSADTRPWVTFARTGTSAPVEDGDTLLRTGRRAGVPLRSNCASGMCGTCKVGLLAGRVEMDHAGGIRQREIEAGTILLCCSTPDGEGDIVVDA